MTIWPEKMIIFLGNRTGFVEKIIKGIGVDKCPQFIYDYGMIADYQNVDDCLSACDASTPKLHTIRVDQNKRWKPGMKIHFKIWTGKPYKSKTFDFAPLTECVSIQEIRIEHDTSNLWPPVYIDNKLMSIGQIEKLAINDGFNDLRHFYSYFNENFTGRIIHWTNLKYE